MMKISRELFQEQRHPRFGTANPNRMRMACWEWMVRSGRTPYGIREELGVEADDRGGPDWFFQRDGQSRTELADGRIIFVGGEYEQSSDPDFCIYNDVVVRGPGDEVAIYGYPKGVFPATDFHTATSIGDRIILIGCIGYPSDRVSGFTPAYSLDVATCRIEWIETRGEFPGWIHEHEADFDPEGNTITVRRGVTMVARGEEQYWPQNTEDYRLHLANGRWEQLTRRNWRQFQLVRPDRRF
jgi:hypothetical protein